MSKKVIIGIIVFVCIIVLGIVGVMGLTVFNIINKNAAYEDILSEQEQIKDAQDQIFENVFEQMENSNNKDNQNDKNDRTELDLNEKEEKATFSMGEWTNNIYTNKFLGLKYTLPANWTYSSDEEIAKMMNIGVELLNDNQKVAKELSDLTSAYYMVTKDSTGGSNVTLLSERTQLSVSSKFYLTQVRTQLEALESIKYQFVEATKEMVAGKECDTLVMSVPSNGITQKYYVYKIDEYFVSIILTSTNDGANFNSMISCFDKI